jgi:outer membrane protein assembly factor BamB
MITGAVMVAALAGADEVGARARSTPGTDWAQFGFIASHTNYNPFEKVLSPSNVARLRLAWSQRIGPGSTGCCVQLSPVEAGGVVYVGSGADGVYAFDASTGHKLWSDFFGDEDGMNTSPAVAAGVVYTDDVDATMYALDASTGHALAWCQFGCENLGYDPPSATVDNGVVYIGGNAFQASNGHELWSSSVGVRWPAVAGGVLYGGSGHKMYALRASNGHVLWSYTGPGGEHSAQSPVAVTRGADGVVYFGSGPSVYALRASNGRKLWSYRTGAALSTLPAVARGIVYLGLGGRVYALRASNGHRLWSSSPGGGGLSSPAVANGVVYVGSGDGRVYALRASNGEKLWSSRAGVGGSPVVANGMVYAGTGKLDAFALPANANQAVARPKASRAKPNRSRRPSRGTS